MVMGFDSMIEFKAGSLGKAKNKEEARTMLKSFVGQSQQIVSGFTLIGQYQGQPFRIVEHQATTAEFRKDITDHEIEHYLSFGDWEGKCGAYSILGPGILFLDYIEGDFQNIIGVPVIKIGQAIKAKLGLSWLELLQPKK
jgi:septum formation protein